MTSVVLTVHIVRRQTSMTVLRGVLTWLFRTVLETVSEVPPGSHCTMAAASAGN